MPRAAAFVFRQQASTVIEPCFCLPQVELMPLPEGAPEEQDVTCGSKSGVFVTRTQRVLVDGVEMSASRFEQVGVGCWLRRKHKFTQLHMSVRGNHLRQPAAIPCIVACNLGCRAARHTHQSSSRSGSSDAQVAGKGDAKKWKCSIYADTHDGPLVRREAVAASRHCDVAQSVLRRPPACPPGD